MKKYISSKSGDIKLLVAQFSKKIDVGQFEELFIKYILLQSQT